MCRLLVLTCILALGRAVPAPETKAEGAPAPETEEAGTLAPETKEAGTPASATEEATRKIEVYEGVYVNFPRDGRNGSEHLVSFDIDLDNGDNSDESEGRARRKRFMQRILPLFIMPFIIQAAIVPIFLSILKFMLLKALMVGKTALLLIVLNAFRQSNAFKGRFEQRMADQHYGYHGNGMEEYGVYVN